MKEFSLKKPSLSYTEEEFLNALKVVFAVAKTQSEGAIVVDRLCVFFGLDPVVARVDPTKLLTSEDE